MNTTGRRGLKITRTVLARAEVLAPLKIEVRSEKETIFLDNVSDLSSATSTEIITRVSARKWIQQQGIDIVEQINGKGTVSLIGTLLNACRVTVTSVSKSTQNEKQQDQHDVLKRITS